MTPQARSADAWEQLWRWWIGLYVAAGLVVAIVLLVDPAAAGVRRLVGVPLVAAMIVGYWRAGYPAAVADDDRRGAIYIAAAIACEVVLLVCHPAAFTMLFGLYPQCYATFTRLRFAIIAAGVLTIVVAIASFGWSGWDTAQLASVGIQVGFSTAFGMVFAVWITRIIRQSRERASLIAELERTRAELAVAHHAQGVAEERDRLAGEIHDTLAQGFTSIVLLAQTAAAKASGSATADLELAAIEQTARENLSEARALVTALGPTALREMSLPDALRRLALRASAGASLNVDFQLIGRPRTLAVGVEAALLRAAQESLANVRRHSQADRADLGLTYTDGEVVLTVVDNGCGFDISAEHAGYGLAGMRRRAEHIGGRLALASRPGRTEVLLRVVDSAGENRSVRDTTDIESGIAHEGWGEASERRTHPPVATSGAGDG